MDRPFRSCVLVSFGYWVRFSVTVAQDLNEINQIIFLLLSELEIPDLPVRLCRGSRLGWWYSRDVLNVVEHLGRREERSVVGRRSFAKVEDDLFTVGIWVGADHLPAPRLPPARDEGRWTTHVQPESVALSAFPTRWAGAIPGRRL